MELVTICDRFRSLKHSTTEPYAFTEQGGNNVLYDLCKRYPGHRHIDEIVAKIWLIGRSYAASIERRQNKKESSDRFYVTVAKRLINSEIDKYIDTIPNEDKLNKINLFSICKAHRYLSEIFYELTMKYKASLASKYLHFHKPIVPIYDSRANKSIGQIMAGVTVCKKYQELFTKPYERKEYNKFAIKMLYLQDFLLEKTRRVYTVREIDKYLLERLE